MNSNYVHVTTGRTRGGIVVNNGVYRLLDEAKRDKDGLYITVEGVGNDGLRAGRNRIYVENESCFRATDQEAAVRSIQFNGAAEIEAPKVDTRTDEEIAIGLRDTFDILGQMTDAVASGIVRGLVVSGPAGIGKSHTVESTLVRSLSMLGRLNGLGSMYDIVSGAMSAAKLYEKLWEYKEEGQVLVFDDCDSILYDEDALNILKAALDSKKTRQISWNSRSHYLAQNDIPNRFEYKGGIVFITNVKFDAVRSQRISNHLEAIVSRCHYMDIGIDSGREKVIHIKNVVERSNMLADYNFTNEEKAEVTNYVYENHEKLRELSLRMVLKIADLRRAMPGNWTKLVEKNCHKR